MSAPDAEAVRRAVAGAFPDLHVERCTFLAEGWDSSAWEVNGALVFRFPKRAEVAGWLAKEINLLPALAPALPVAVPRFTHVARSGTPADPALPFAGYPALRGDFLSARPELLAAGSPLLGQLGAFLGALHGFPVEQAVAVGVPASSWAEWVAGWRRWWSYLNVAGALHFEPDVCRLVRDTGDDFLKELTVSAGSVTLVHHDLALEHILVTPDGARLAGVIDWGDAAIGDPALDFAAFAGQCAPAALNELLAAYGRAIDDAFLRRAAWYARLAPYHTLYFGLKTDDQAMVAQGLAAVGA
jgi:aminoglycoside 2''-phosphotransferase